MSLPERAGAGDSELLREVHSYSSSSSPAWRAPAVALQTVPVEASKPYEGTPTTYSSLTSLFLVQKVHTHHLRSIAFTRAATGKESVVPGR